jgi:hypothetical protein
MKKTCLVAAIVILLVQSQAFSQSQEVPKYEVAAEFTTLERDNEYTGQRTEPGFGGRFTYNINRIFSVEGAGYFFPKRCFDCVNPGRVTQVLGGVKVGKRFENWGIFAKVRPGVVSFSQGDFDIIPTGAGGAFPFQFEIIRVNAFATDVGGVIEFYPSKRIVTRIDAGDTIMHFGRSVRNRINFNPVTQDITLVPFARPSRTTHHFQFVTSVGFRF